jgi:hypothetical protein
MNPLSQPQDGFPSLLSIVQSAIKHKYISFLGDLGSIEVRLLEDVLTACSPQQLQHIEDATLHGLCKRDLTEYTWPLWYTHCRNNDSHGFFSSLKSFPPLPPPPRGGFHVQPLGLPLPENVAPANFRLVFEQMTKHREEKLAQTGKRLKAMREKQEKEKASRSIQVRTSTRRSIYFYFRFFFLLSAMYDFVFTKFIVFSSILQVIDRLDKRGRPIPSLRKPIGAAAAVGAASGSAFGSRASQAPKQQHQKQPSVKDRLMKKLNVPKSSMKTSGSHQSHNTANFSGGENIGKSKPKLTAAVVAGRVKVKTPAELAREEAQRKLDKLKAASVLNDDDIFFRRKR